MEAPGPGSFLYLRAWGRIDTITLGLGCGWVLAFTWDGDLRAVKMMSRDWDMWDWLG